MRTMSIHVKFIVMGSLIVRNSVCIKILVTCVIDTDMKNHITFHQL